MGRNYRRSLPIVMVHFARLPALDSPVRGAPSAAPRADMKKRPDGD
jgi:hypothetical protein